MCLSFFSTHVLPPIRIGLLGLGISAWSSHSISVEIVHLCGFYLLQMIKFIPIPGFSADDFPCPLNDNWTVADVINAICNAYPLTGGYIRNHGAATRSSHIIVEDGDYVYVDFRRTQTTTVAAASTGGK